MKRSLIVLSFLLSSFIIQAQQLWKPYSNEILFKIKNAGFTVTGRFQGLTTSIKFSPEKLSASSLKGSVEVASIKTGIDKRDKDLKKEEYFNADKYKTIELVTANIYKKDTFFAAIFNVTIKGITKQVEVPLHFVQSGKEATFNGNFHINRRDYGVGGKSMMMADDVNVSIVIHARAD